MTIKFIVPGKKRKELAQTIGTWLGFIGEEYKAERKILLRKLSGSSAFKSGSRKEVSNAVSK